MGPLDSYICFIPQPLQSGPSLQDNSDADITPARSWSLLQPLTGTCLYVRVLPFLLSLLEVIPPYSIVKAGSPILTAIMMKSVSSEK